MTEKLKGYYKAKCSYNREHEICEFTDEQREKYQCMEKDGYCLSIIHIDSLE